MSEPSSPIEGSKSPTDKAMKKKGAEPNPDKFKELLKADESDETKKQKKKQENTEIEEELDNEDVDEDSLAE